MYMFICWTALRYGELYEKQSQMTNPRNLKAQNNRTCLYILLNCAEIFHLGVVENNMAYFEGEKHLI